MANFHRLSFSELRRDNSFSRLIMRLKVMRFIPFSSITRYITVKNVYISAVTRMIFKHFLIKENVPITLLNTDESINLLYA